MTASISANYKASSHAKNRGVAEIHVFLSFSQNRDKPESSTNFAYIRNHVITSPPHKLTSIRPSRPGCQEWTLRLSVIPPPLLILRMNAAPPPSAHALSPLDSCLLQLSQHVSPGHHSRGNCRQDRELSCSWYVRPNLETSIRAEIVRKEDTRSLTGGSTSHSTTLHPPAKPLSFLRGARSRTRATTMVNPGRSCPTVSQDSALACCQPINDSRCF